MRTGTTSERMRRTFGRWAALAALVSAGCGGLAGCGGATSIAGKAGEYTVRGGSYDDLQSEGLSACPMGFIHLDGGTGADDNTWHIRCLSASDIGSN